MRVIWVSFIALFVLGAGPSMATPSDFIELGLGLQSMLDWNTFNSPNELDMNNDVFKLDGDYGMGYALNATMGHQYTSRDFIIKYSFYGTMNNTKDLTGGETRSSMFRSHTFLAGARYHLRPVGRFSSFVDLAIGAVTGVYEQSFFDGSDHWIRDERTVSTGFVGNLSYGLAMQMNSSLDLFARFDLFMGKIPDRYDVRNYKTGNGPAMHSTALNIGLRKYFVSPF